MASIVKISAEMHSFSRLLMSVQFVIWEWAIIV